MSLKCIHINFIPHEAQRYETTGDWVVDDDETLSIYVSDLGCDRQNAAIAIHEMVEAILCGYDGIPQDEVDAFDIRFEDNRVVGDDSEPGDDPAAPYYQQHQAATIVERTVVSEFGLDWNQYDQNVREL